MTWTPKLPVATIKSRLSALKRRTRFVDYGESGKFADELFGLLQDLKAAAPDPRTGLELLAKFYEADDVTLERCDDSNGEIGDVFQHDAMDIFVHFASKVEDKEWLAGFILDLCRDDEYCVRESVIHAASKYLPEPIMRLMIDLLQNTPVGKDSAEKHWHRLIESLARQCKDAPLFEKTRLSWAEPYPVTCMDIGRVYLECGDAKSAVAWLLKAPKRNEYDELERDKLLGEAYGKLGDTGKQSEAAWKVFRSCRSGEALGKLLALIGENKRDFVISGETENILNRKELSLSDAEFLLEAGRVQEAEEYLLAKRNLLDGDNYGPLVTLAKSLETCGRPLCASVIYRALLDSILRRALSKYYHHGIRYLKKLDKLAASISDWRDIAPHPAYLEGLRELHKRKYSFWERYG